MVLVLALFVLGFAARECHRAWGLGGAALVVLGSLGLILLVPFGAFVSVVTSVSIGSAARRTKMREAIRKLDDDAPLPLKSGRPERIGGQTDDPWEPPAS